MTKLPLTRFQRLGRIDRINYAMGNLQTALNQLRDGCEACDKSAIEYMELAVTNLQTPIKELED